MTVGDELRRAAAALEQVQVPVPPYRRLQQRRRVRRTAGALVGAAIVLVALAVVAALPGDQGGGRVTSGGPDRTTVPATTAPTAPSTTTTSGPTEVETEAFCSYTADFDEEQPESYVGSAEHVADIQGMVDVAPEEIRAQAETYLAFLVGGGIDPDDPDTRLTETFPPEVRSAIEDITGYIETTC